MPTHPTPSCYIPLQFHTGKDARALARPCVCVCVLPRFWLHAFWKGSLSETSLLYRWTLETGEPATAVYLSPSQGGVSIIKGFTPNPGSSEVEKQEEAGLDMRLAEIREGQSRLGVREICQDPQQASAVNQEGPLVSGNDERGCPDITANGVSRDSSSTDWGSPAESSGVVEAGPHDLLRMEEGQELLISYNFSPDVPRMSYFLNFGFVPQVVEEH